MTYREWKAIQDGKYGAGTVDLQRKMRYNELKDSDQYAAYRERLGNDAPKSFVAFQKLKYSDKEGYDDLVEYFRYKGRVPEATKSNYKDYIAIKNTGVIGVVRVPPESINTDDLVFKDSHGMRHGCTLDDAKHYISTAKCSVSRKRWDGVCVNYFSPDGASYVHPETMKIKTAFSKTDFDPQTKSIMEVFK